MTHPSTQPSMTQEYSGGEADRVWPGAYHKSGRVAWVMFLIVCTCNCPPYVYNANLYIITINWSMPVDAQPWSIITKCIVTKFGL